MSAEGNFFRRRRMAENDAIFVNLLRVNITVQCHNILWRMRNDSFDTYGVMTVWITQFRNNHDLFLFQMKVMRGKLRNRIDFRHVCSQLVLRHYVRNKICVSVLLISVIDQKCWISEISVGGQNFEWHSVTGIVSNCIYIGSVGSMYVGTG